MCFPYYCRDPPGTLKAIVQVSAARAALIDTDREDPDESAMDRPLSREELRTRAAAFAKSTLAAEVSGCGGCLLR